MIKKHNNNLLGKHIVLKPYTKDFCHEFYKEYVSDYQMTETEFVYNKESVDNYFELKNSLENRIIFAVLLDRQVVGEIQLKYIDFDDLHATLSVVLKNDSVKGRGYGTEAEKLIIDYAFNELNVKKVYADTTYRNVRSKHILLKLGFIHIKDEDEMSYFELLKDMRTYA